MTYDDLRDIALKTEAEAETLRLCWVSAKKAYDYCQKCLRDNDRSEVSRLSECTDATEATAMAVWQSAMDRDTAAWRDVDAAREEINERVRERERRDS